MIKIAKKMPITVTLLVFSYLIAVCGIGVGSLWMLFKFKDMNSFMYGFLILIGSLFLAALIRMFADIGQMMFDLKVGIQCSFKQTNELGQRLNQELRNQLQLQADTLNQKLQLQSDTLNQNIQLQINTLNQGLQTIIGRFDKTFHEANELDQRLSQELKIQLQLQADTLNQNLLNIIQNLGQSSHEAKELSQKLAAIKDNFDQMNCDSKDMNQSIHQIRTFFEQIERHLDLKK